MHPYSIDTEERKYVLFLIAIIGVLFAWGFYKLLGYYNILLPWWVESPSVFAFYGILYLVFDKWLWKIAKRFKLIKTPDINGEWKGILRSSFDELADEKSATLRIFQTWTRIRIVQETDQSISHSESASIVAETPEGPHINYQYMNEPKPDAANTMNIHRGTCRLSYVKKENKLIGEYYSGRDRQNFGSLIFRRINS
jgi:hypothetical protein